MNLRSSRSVTLYFLVKILAKFLSRLTDNFFSLYHSVADSVYQNTEECANGYDGHVGSVKIHLETFHPEPFKWLVHYQAPYKPIEDLACEKPSAGRPLTFILTAFSMIS